jgi:hypothetical protein
VIGDVTKTGLIAPGLGTVFRLKARYGDRLWIMVDACQLRISPETIRAYLARGMMVAITGSKFMEGRFSAAPCSARPLFRSGCRRRPRHWRSAPMLVRTMCRKEGEHAE